MVTLAFLVVIWNCYLIVVNDHIHAVYLEQLKKKKLLKIIDLEKGFESFTNHKREKEKEDTGLWQTMFM